MSADKIDTSAVYTLFEELKQEISSFKRQAQGIELKDSVDVSKTNQLIDKLLIVLEKQKFSAEQVEVLKYSIAEVVGLAMKKSFDKIDEKHAELYERFTAIEEKVALSRNGSRSIIRKEHSISIDFKSSKTVITMLTLGFALFLSLAVNLWQISKTTEHSDNDLKYRYIKMYGEVDKNNLLLIEDVFTYKRDKKRISAIRRQVEKYEQLIKEQAESIERSRLNASKVESLQKEVEAVKKK